MILLTLWAVAALVLECTASLPPGRPTRLNKVGFDSTKLVECAEQPKTQKINAGQTFHIQSPKYSKYYPTMECGWIFQVTGTENVMVACSKFEMEKRDRNGNCKDFLQIGDRKFCGKNGPKNITVNVKKLVEVKFASNKSAGGFSCTMTALFNNSNTLRQSAPSCTSLEFSCAPGECIPIWHDCDGITDCSNGLDEIDCPPPCTSIEFRCKPGECIPIWHDCDDVTDCSNGLDDYDCPPPCDSSEFRCKPGECIPIEWDCDGITDCSNALDQYDCPKKWSDIRNACIKGNNNNDYPGMTIDECKEKCENEESYSCQSIEYNPRNKGCYLSEAMSSSSDLYVPCYVRGWLYMEILHDPCEMDNEWSDIRNACIRGNNNQDFKGVSIDVCKEKCFNENSFKCQSIEYRSSDKWCFLSEVRSTSSDYNVPCYVDGWIYTERLREDCVTAVCDPECLNNGICVGLDECRCKKGWKGDNCETAVCEPECINNGNCIGPNECECQEGWEGNHCQTAVCDGDDNGNRSISNIFDVSLMVNSERYIDRLSDKNSLEFASMKEKIDYLVLPLLKKTMGSKCFKFEVTAFKEGPPVDICPTYFDSENYNKNTFLEVIGELREYSVSNKESRNEGNKTFVETRDSDSEAEETEQTVETELNDDEIIAAADLVIRTKMCNGCNCQLGRGDDCNDKKYDVSFILKNEEYNNNLADKGSSKFVELKKRAENLVGVALKNALGPKLHNFKVTDFKEGPSLDVCSSPCLSRGGDSSCRMPVSGDKRSRSVSVSSTAETDSQVIEDDISAPLLCQDTDESTESISFVQCAQSRPDHVDHECCSLLPDYMCSHDFVRQLCQDECARIGPQDHPLCSNIQHYKCDNRVDNVDGIVLSNVNQYCPTRCDMADNEVKCEWKWKSAERRPIIVINNKLLHPKPNQVYRYSVNRDDTDLTLICKGNGNHFMNFGQQTITARCYGDGKFYVTDFENGFPDEGHRVEDMECENKIHADITPFPDDPLICKGYLLKIGFNDVQPFHELIKVCFERNLQKTIWTKHTIQGKSLLAGDNRPDTKFNFGPMPFFTPGDQSYFTVNLPTLYKSFPYITRLGLEDFAIKCSESLRLDKGHMAPSGDFVTSTEKQASFYYINSFPQWSTINQGNWLKVEFSVQNLAKHLGEDLEIITGGLEVLKDIYLKSDPNKVPVPDFTWKIVYEPNYGVGAAFVVSNNPFDEQFNSGHVNDCYSHNICGDLGWIVTNNLNDKTLGRTICCKIEDLIKDLTRANIHIPYAFPGNDLLII